MKPAIREGLRSDFAYALEKMITSKGNDLLSYSYEKPVLLVFLRQFGCIFCREGLQELSKQQEKIIKLGYNIVFVHLSDDNTAIHYFKNYKIKNPEFVCDPGMNYYAAFGLGKGTTKQLFGLKTWVRGFEASILKGNSYSRVIGDGLQMPGVFILQHGTIKSQFIHDLISDKPNYDDLLNCCIITDK
ncbi:MAG TPA: SelL-related redox protein [Saprospiraceae bacterium]|nr:SelL-related redox protein [Saprospiraceae bacterium]